MVRGGGGSVQFDRAATDLEQNGAHRHAFARNYDRRVVITRQSISAIAATGAAAACGRVEEGFANRRER